METHPYPVATQGPACLCTAVLQHQLSCCNGLFESYLNINSDHWILLLIVESRPAVAERREHGKYTGLSPSETRAEQECPL